MCDPLGKKTAKALNVKQSTLLTGVRTKNPLGMIVDPLNVSGKFDDPEAPVTPDAAAEALKAQNDKQSLINAELSRQKGKRRGSALSTGAQSDLAGGGGAISTTTYGKSTTGG